MFFDTTLNLLQISTEAPSEEDLANGAEALLTMALTPGLMLPVANPQNPTQPLIVAVGTYRFRLDRDMACNVGAKLTEEGEKLPRPLPVSQIATASSMADVAGMARDLGNFR